MARLGAIQITRREIFSSVAGGQASANFGHWSRRRRCRRRSALGGCAQPAKIAVVNRPR